MFNFFRQSTPKDLPAKKVFSLAISEKLVQASLWEVDKNVNVLAKSTAKAYFNDNDLLIKLDQCLQELGSEGQTVHQTLFHLDSAFTNENGILPDKKPFFEHITESLQLDSLGFVANSEAVIHSKISQNPDLKQQLVVEFTATRVVFSFYQKKVLLERCELADDADFASLMKAALVQMAGKIGVDYSSCFIPKTDELAPSEEPKEALFVNFISALLTTNDIEQKIAQLPSSLPMRSEILGSDILLSYILLPSATVLATSYGWLSLPQSDAEEVPPIEPVVTPTPKLLSRRQFQPTVENSDFSPSSSLKKEAKNLFYPLSLTKKSIFITVILAIFTLTLSAFLFFFTQTKLTIYLTPKKSLLAKKIEVVIDPQSKTADYENLILPGEVVTKELAYDYTFAATGKKEVGASAQGEIEISNKTTEEKKFAGGSIASDGTYSYSFDSEVTVPAASVTTTEDGETKTFGKAKVKVTANQPGSAGNLSLDTSLTVGTLSTSAFEAKVSSAFTGGTDKTETVFSAADQKQAIIDADKELLALAIKEIGTQAEGKYLVVQQNGFKVGKRAFDTQLEESATEVTLSITATIPVISYQLDQLQPLAQAILSKELPADYEFAPTTPDVLSAINDTKTAQAASKIYLSVDLSQETRTKIDQEAIKNAVLGQNITKVENYLKNMSALKAYSLDWSNDFFGKLHRQAPNKSGKVSLVNTLE